MLTLIVNYFSYTSLAFAAMTESMYCTAVWIRGMNIYQVNRYTQTEEVYMVFWMLWWPLRSQVLTLYNTCIWQCLYFKTVLALFFCISITFMSFMTTYDGYVQITLLVLGWALWEWCYHIHALLLAYTWSFWYCSCTFLVKMTWAIRWSMLKVVKCLSVVKLL